MSDLRLDRVLAQYQYVGAGAARTTTVGRRHAYAVREMPLRRLHIPHAQPMLDAKAGERERNGRGRWQAFAFRWWARTARKGLLIRRLLMRALRA